jgi:DNA polymerase IV
MEKFIVHLDMDAFFASIEQRDDPRLKGKPVVVGADPRQGRGRGVVSTCSYEARKFGIRSAMPISRAFKLCPEAFFVPVQMEKYARESAAVFAILGAFTPELEPVSIDEAYLDISSTFHLFGTTRQACVQMKRRISAETGLTASVGLAPTKMAAKIASDLGKPDGLIEVRQAQLRDFLRPLEAGVIWGLGPKAEERLSALGIRTVGDLADRNPRELEGLFGKNGLYFWQAANGIDERQVEAGGEAQSISAETTFERDTRDTRQVEAEIAELCERVSRRLRQDKVRCRTITLKIRFADFTTHTRSFTRPEPTNFTEELIGEAQKLYDSVARGSNKIRLIGVKASQLLPPETQLSLFGEDRARQKEKVHDAVDKIKDKFGEDAISRARQLLAP